MKKEAYFQTVADLVKRGPKDIPAEFISSEHVIYNSPASLAFNSPGAEGFGVKRAGLAVPGSVMLLIGPGCCGRNTTVLGEMSGYSDRFFFYTMDETDIVTGRHLKFIPRAIEEICETLTVKPSAVMICVTCADALLGTDMEQVCRRATKKVGLPVVPCYMYALTREGRKPPMVAVRQAVYSLLEKTKRRGDVVNILGYFSPLLDNCEIYGLLQQAGVKTVRELSRCVDFCAYKKMSEANFNLVLHPESRLAAQYMEEHLGIPGIELTRLYQIDKIHKQYMIFAKIIGTTLDDTSFRREAEEAVEAFLKKDGHISLAIGEMANADPFELALALSKYGLHVEKIYGTVTAESFVYLRQLTVVAPYIKVYSNLSPTMLYYKDDGDVGLTVGKDAAYYHPRAAHVFWTQEVQPFGYAGVTALFACMERALEGGI